MSEHAAHMGAYFLNQLKKNLANNPYIIDLRGQGLMIGIELAKPDPDLMLNCIKAKLLFNITRKNIIRLLPPLIINKQQIDLAVEKLSLLLYKKYD